MSMGSCRSGGNTCGNSVVNLFSGLKRSAQVLYTHRIRLPPFLVYALSVLHLDVGIALIVVALLVSR